MTDLPLIEAFDQFLNSLKAAKKSPHTVAAYRRDLEAVADLLVDPINKAIDDMRLADVTVPALRSAFGIRAEDLGCFDNGADPLDLDPLLQVLPLRKYHHRVAD